MDDSVPISPAKRQIDTLVNLLRARADQQADQRAFSFLLDGETQEAHLTFAGLDTQARAIAAVLMERGAVGQRAVLIFPPGLDFICGFFGCIYAQVTAVPIPTPDPQLLQQSLPRVAAVLSDAQAAFILTTTRLKALLEPQASQLPGVSQLQWIATDACDLAAAARWKEPDVQPEALAYLQYTSGSTRIPRGVKLTHENLIANLEGIHQCFKLTPQDSAVIWLPAHHNMGLIGGILEPIYSGCHCVLMSPLAFLQRPVRWLQAISRFRASITGGPNFAYDLCSSRISPDQCAGLDLRSLDIAFCGSEPVRPETIDRFVAAFSPYGFRRESFLPAYGLAEASLVVSCPRRGRGPLTRRLDRTALEFNQAIEAQALHGKIQEAVGCGNSLMGQKILIVHPQTRTECKASEIGEIWLAGPNVSQGYWGQPQETQETFCGYLAEPHAGPYLRTGDLGFLLGHELFITGRIKDLIIVRGYNFYPQDLEFAVTRSHPAFRSGNCAAFSALIDGEEQVVFLQEVDPSQFPNLEELTDGIRKTISQEFEIQVQRVALVEPGSLPKTTSGKIQRHACRKSLLEKGLAIVRESIQQKPSPSAAGPASPVDRSLLQEALLALPPELRRSLLQSQVKNTIAQVLKVDPVRIKPETSLAILGVDSILSVELQQEIEKVVQVNLPLGDLVQGVSLNGLVERILAMLESEGSTAPVPLLDRAATSFAAQTGEFPTSYGQRALWVIQKIFPASAAYNIAYAARLRSELDFTRMERCLKRVADRHPALRTTFNEANGEPVQRIHTTPQFLLQQTDISGWTAGELEAEMARRVYCPFDLTNGPLTRFFIYSQSPEDHTILLVMHHIITDMWSVALLLYELGQFYQAEISGAEPVLRPTQESYAGYAERQKAMLNSPEADAHWLYWQKKLAGDLPVLNLPTDHPRPAVQTDRGAGLFLKLDAGLSEAIHTLAKQQGTSLFATLLAAFQVLLHRYTGQTDILVGSAKAGRDRANATTIGYFINPVVLRADCSGDPPFSAFLKRVHQEVVEAAEHDDFPFPLLVERLQPVRDPSYSPIFQVSISMQKTTRMMDSRGMSAFALGEPGIPVDLGGLVLETYPLKARVAPFDLTIGIAELDAELGISIEYNTALYEGKTIRRMMAHLQTLLTAIVRGPDQPISTLPLLSDAERHQLLVEWNRTQTFEAPALCIHRLFEAQARQTANSTALISGDQQISYQELNQRANRLARCLVERGLATGQRVGVCLDRSPELIVSLLGILKAGGTYLPLDPTYPTERLAYMLADAGIEILITQESIREKHAFKCRDILSLDTETGSFANDADQDLDYGPQREDPAYVIYTSGSTGAPKGVLVSHGCLADHCRDIGRYYQMTPEDRVLQFASPSFDASLEQIVTALICGATLVLRDVELWAPADFSAHIAELGLTVVNIPPSYWHLWAQEEARSPSLPAPTALRLVIIGGDVLRAESLDLWQQTHFSRARLINAYGPTETTITATVYEVPQDPQATRGLWKIPIGRPLPNRSAYILDPSGQPTPIGVPAELYLGGTGVAMGYLDRPELSAQKFIPNPFTAPSLSGSSSAGGSPGPAQNDRLYRTGDLARYLEDGNIQFLGRLDHQVKLRGFRIELGEIEAVLCQHPAIAQAAVLLRPDPQARSIDPVIAAYLVIRPEMAFDLDQIKGFLRQRVPSYMLPSVFIRIAEMPLSPGGKIDPRALLSMIPGRDEPDRPYLGPRTPIEQELADLWADLLHIQKVDVRDSFFDLGGHSLLAAQLISRIRDRYKIEIPLARLFAEPRIEALAEVITEQLIAEENPEELERLLDDIEPQPGDPQKISPSEPTQA